MSQTHFCFLFFSQEKSLILVVVNTVSPELLQWPQQRDGCLIHENKHQRSRPCLGSHVGHTAHRLLKNKISEYRLLTEGWLTSVHHNHNASLVAYTVKRKLHSAWETKHSITCLGRPNQYVLTQISIVVWILRKKGNLGGDRDTLLSPEQNHGIRNIWV